MFLKLNLYCIEKILNNLNLTEHLVLSQTHPILQEIIACKFKRKFKSGLQLTNYWQQFGNKISVPPYLRYIMDNETESIECDVNEIYKIKNALNGLEFTRVKSIIAKMVYINGNASNEVRYLLHELFPNLRALKIKGNYREDLFWIPYIKEIEILSKPEGNIWNLLCNPNFEKLTFHEAFDDWKNFKLLKVPTGLEELTLCISDYDVVNKYLKFNHILNLRKLTITKVTEDIELSLHESHFYRSIDSIAFNTKYCPSIFAKFSNLQRLLIVNDNGKTLNEFCKLDIDEWNKIEEIFYIQTSDDSNIDNQKKNLLFMVKHCKDLDMLDISGSKFDMDFIKSLIELLASQLRTGKLFLNCFNTQIPKDLKCPEITFSFQELNYELPAEAEIQIEFNKEKKIMEVIRYVKRITESHRVRNSKLDYYMDFLFRIENDLDKIKKELAAIEATLDVAIGPLTKHETSLREHIFFLHYELKRNIEIILAQFWF